MATPEKQTISSTGPRRRGGEADPVRNSAEVPIIYRTFRRLGMFREAELFILGCNCALRISDLLMLRNCDIHRKKLPNGEVVGTVYDKDLIERKTGKRKTLTINSAGMAAVDRMIALNPDAEYLFEGTGARAKPGTPVSSSWVNRCFRTVREKLSLDYRFSTHSMRKTFGYHAYKNGVPAETLMYLFNHSSATVTIKYIGITADVVEQAYIDNQVGVMLDV